MISLRQKTKGLFSDSDLVKLIMPLILEQFLAVFIGFADTFMVTSCGEAAVSAVSLVDSINVLIIQFLAALSTGGAVITAQYIGNKDKINASETIKQLYYTVIIISLILTLPFIFARKSILSLIFGTIEKSVMTGAVSYCLVTAISYPFIAVFNAGAASMRAMGNSKISLFCSFIMNIINIAGNALLIFVFDMGVIGAAIATLVSRIVGSIIITYTICSDKNQIHINNIFKSKIKFSLVKKILSIGIPSGLDSGMFQLGKLMLQSLTATFGTAVIAANAIASSIANFANLFGISFSLAMITVVGQCLGAGKKDEARFYGNHLLKLCYFFAGITYLLFLVFAKPIISLFNLSPQAAELAAFLMQGFAIVAIFFWPPSFVLPNALRASGDTKLTMTVSMLSMWIFRIGFGYLLGAYFNLGIKGIWYAMYIDWIARSIVFVTRYKGNKWLNIKVI